MNLRLFQQTLLELSSNSPTIHMMNRDNPTRPCPRCEIYTLIQKNK